MNCRILNVSLCLILAIPLCGDLVLPVRAYQNNASAQAQETSEEKKLRERQEELARKEQERKEKEAKARGKQEKKYLTLRQFAEDLYASDPEFRDQVDREYLNLKSRHALEAYRINTSKEVEVTDNASLGDELQVRRVLYDNPWVQDYVNRIGQRLVPEDSDKLYAFKVTFHPIPYAYTLSTGTILISTGMISLLDNEAQLAYVLGHELAHVYKDHWRVQTMMPLAEEEYNSRQEKKRAIWSAIFAGAGAAIGGVAGGGKGAFIGVGSGAVAGYAISSFFSKKIGLDWDSAQENEADEFALRVALSRSYDIQEVPKLYAAMQQVARVDDRVQLGFLGNRSRIRERSEYAQRALQGALQGQYQQLLKAGTLIGTSPEYNLVMAELKRDNGIEAFRYDMFQMARQNLQQAVSLRSDDALAAYHYSRVLKLVGRTKEEKENAEQYLMTAIRLDAERKHLPAAQLQRALLLMDRSDPAAQAEAVQSLKNYIVEYRGRSMNDEGRFSHLPPNMNLLYDFLRLLGEKSWEPPPPLLDYVDKIRKVEGAPQMTAQPEPQSGQPVVQPKAIAPLPPRKKKP